MKSIIAIALLALSGIASADTSFDCKYPNYSDMEGAHKTTGDHTIIFNINDAGKTMFTFGDVGGFTREATAIKGDGFVTFVDASPAGNVLTVVVNLSGKYKGQSVYSKATQFIPDTPLIPKQYYGTCTIK